MKQRHWANVIRPTYPVRIVDYGNKVEKNLKKDRLRPVVGTDGGDDCIHVDAKTGEVYHGLHSTNASNHGLPFGLVIIGEIHYVLRSIFYLTWELSFDKDFIPLWKKSGRFHWIGLKFETGNLLGRKFPWSIWDVRIFDMTQIEFWVNRILVKSWCLANSNVICMRSANWLAQAVRGWFRTTGIPFDGMAGVIFDTNVALISMSPRMWNSISLTMPFLASDYFSALAGRWIITLLEA